MSDFWLYQGPYILFTSSFISVILAALVHIKNRCDFQLERNVLGVIILLANTIRLFSTGMEMISYNVQYKIWWDSIEYLGLIPFYYQKVGTYFS